MDAKAPAGIVGLGLMGSAIGSRLIEARFSVLGFDTDPGRRVPMKALGVERAGSSREIADRCRSIVLAVFDTPQLEQVVEEGDKMLRRDYAPESRIAQTLKDAQLMLEAKRLGQRLPLMEANAALLAAATREDGERDSAAVIEAIRASCVS